MTPQRSKKDRLLIPIRGTLDDGGTVIDSMVEIGPDDPDYKKWLDEVEREEAFEALIAKR